jgi:DNA-binding GntR family transcriptional regulator
MPENAAAGRTDTGAAEKMEVSLSGQPFAPRTVADDLHRALQLRIREGDFVPGEMLSIRRLAQEYGTSIIPARDAVRSLVAEGALQFADSRKIIVPRLSAERYHDILFARRTLEGEAAGRAYKTLSQDDARTLREIDGGINRAIRSGDFRRYMKGNHDFHFFIYRRCGSPTILRLIEMLWLQYGPSMRFICDRLGTASIGLDFHSAALEALARGDHPGFRAAIEADIDQGMGIILTA